MNKPLSREHIHQWVHDNLADYLERGTDIVDLTGLGEAYKDEFDIDEARAEDADFDKVLFDTVEAHPQVENVNGDLVWQS